MSAKSRAGSVLLVFAILLLFGLLIVLIGSLDELTFQPGKLLPRTEAIDDGDLVAQRTLPQISSRDQIFIAVLGILTLISIICVVIFRKLRRQLLQYLFTLIAFVLPLTLGIVFFGQLFSGWFQRNSSSEVAAPGPDIPESLLANPPTWSIVLAAGAVSILILGTGAFLVFRWLSFREMINQRNEERASLESEQQALAEQAADTASRIRKGEPLQGEVIRCYQQMDQLLSRRRSIKPTYLTAREFAESLSTIGIRTEHIERLTKLFELVRYGNRDDQSMASQALECLDKLQAEYGEKGEL